MSVKPSRSLYIAIAVVLDIRQFPAEELQIGTDRVGEERRRRGAGQGETTVLATLSSHCHAFPP